MVVSWRAVPKDRQERLRQTHDQILEIIKDGRTPAVVKEYFGIPWEDLDFHAVETIERLEEFLDLLRSQGEPVEVAFQVIYTMGFLSGIRYALDEDHEPEN